jgi:hypothetical protein
MTCLSCDSEERHGGMARKLASDAVVWSRLGKTARSGRRKAYSNKARIVSTLLVKFADSCEIVEISRDPLLGALLLVKLLPIRRWVHVPVVALTEEAKTEVRARVVLVRASSFR